MPNHLGLRPAPPPDPQHAALRHLPRQGGAPGGAPGMRATWFQWGGGGTSLCASTPTAGGTAPETSTPIALQGNGLRVAPPFLTSEEKWQRRRFRRRSFESDSEDSAHGPSHMRALQPNMHPDPHVGAESLYAAMGQSPGHSGRICGTLGEDTGKPESPGRSSNAEPRNHRRNAMSLHSPKPPKHSLNAMPRSSSRDNLRANFPDQTSSSPRALAQNSGCGRPCSDFVVSRAHPLNALPVHRSSDRSSADFSTAAAGARAARGFHSKSMSSARTGVAHAHGDGRTPRRSPGGGIAKRDSSSSSSSTAEGLGGPDSGLGRGRRALSPCAVFGDIEQEQEAKHVQHDLRLAVQRMAQLLNLDCAPGMVDEPHAAHGPSDLPKEPAADEPAADDSPGKAGLRNESSAVSLRVHVLTGGSGKRSIASQAYIMPQAESSVRVHGGAGSSAESASDSLEKARASAEELRFVRRLLKARERAERTQKAIASRSEARQPAARPQAALGTDGRGVPLADPAPASKGMASVGGLQASHKQGQQYIVSRHEVVVKGSLQPEAKQQGVARVEKVVRRVNGGEGEGLVEQGSVELGRVASSTNSSMCASSSVNEDGGLRRNAMSCLAPVQGQRPLDESQSDITRGDVKDERIREATSMLKPHQLSILGKPYRDVREYYALHNKKLGAGRFGNIRRCKDVRTGKVYACKTIHKKKVLGAEEAEGIRAEVAALEMLKGHPSVIDIKGAFEDHQGVHIVMAFCTGGDLFDRIQAKGVLAEPDAARMLAALIAALNQCHSLGIMHRDVKPENVVLASSEVDFDVKLIDFGLSTFFQPGKALHRITGTPEYMAPEVLQKRYGPEADIWSAGVLLYVTLSGLQPFWASSKHGLMTSILGDKPSFKSERWRNVSEESMDLIRRMLEKDPKTRMTGGGILDHPWIKKHVSERVLSD